MTTEPLLGPRLLWRLLLSGLALVGLVSLPLPARGYTFDHQCSGRPGRLDVQGLAWTVNGCSLPVGSLQRDAFDTALAQWSWYSKKPVSLFPLEATDCNATSSDGQNDFAVTSRSNIWSDANGLTSFHHYNICVDPSGWEEILHPPFGDYSEADTVIASDLSFVKRAQSDGYGRYSWDVGTGRATMVHEMSHALGLGHNTVFSDLNELSHARPGGFFGPGPMPDDVAGVDYLYGSKNVVDLIPHGQREAATILGQSNIVTNHESPEIVCQGDTFTLRLTTLNMSPSAKTYNQKVYLSTDVSGINTTTSWTSFGLNALAGIPTQQVIAATVPSWTPPGEYYLMHSVTLANGAEFTTANNKLRYTGKVIVRDCSSRFTRGDFNVDGRADLVITTGLGSFWYLAKTTTGEWDTTTYPSRSDLPRGNVRYTPGDFNGDGRTDLVVTTALGSFFYIAKTTPGQWDTTSFPSRPDLPLTNASFTPADFDGDGKTDLIVTTSAGSFFYYSKGIVNGVGSWDTAYQLSLDIDGVNRVKTADVPRGMVEFTTGDFDGNGKQDMIVTSRFGSIWAYSKGRGLWDEAVAGMTVYRRWDLPLNSVKYTVGDFDGNFKHDLIVTVPAGSYWFFAGAAKGYFDTKYTRTDLPYGTVDYATGDFDGGGKSDVIITNANGSFWYYFNGFDAQGFAIWNTQYQRTDLTRGSVMYTIGDFNKDLKRDVVITVAGGSYWYYSTGLDTNGLATWNVAYTRTDLPL